MCRLIAIIKPEGIGKELFHKCFDAIVAMSKDLTKEHELHSLLNMELGEFVHGDGFGLGYYKNGEHHAFRSSDPIWLYELDELLLNDIYKSPYVMIHSRKASPGLAINLLMVHPFIRVSPTLGKTVLAHNGTVKRYKELQFGDHYKTDIESDSEHLLLHFLTKMEESTAGTSKALHQAVLNLPEETSANFFLVQGQKFWASRNYYRFDAYLELYTMSGEDHTILSSEIIDSLGESSSWRLLQNKEMFYVPDILNSLESEYLN